MVMITFALIFLTNTLENIPKKLENSGFSAASRHTDSQPY